MMLTYFSSLRDVTHKASEKWNRPAATLGDLLRDLTAAYGAEFGSWVVTEGNQSNHAMIMVDGSDVRGALGLATPLTPDSQIVIFPPVMGG